MEGNKKQEGIKTEEEKQNSHCFSDLYCLHIKSTKSYKRNNGLNSNLKIIYITPINECNLNLVLVRTE